jgi:hypothetical protein
MSSMTVVLTGGDKIEELAGVLRYSSRLVTTTPFFLGIAGSGRSVHWLCSI